MPNAHCRFHRLSALHREVHYSGLATESKTSDSCEVYVKCSVCKNTLEFRVVAIDVAYHPLESKPHAAVVRIEPPTPNNEPKFYDVPGYLPRHVVDSINSQISNTS